jgi:hypothetical protein
MSSNTVVVWNLVVWKCMCLNTRLLMELNECKYLIVYGAE